MDRDVEPLEDKWRRLAELRFTLGRRQAAVDNLTRRIAELQAEIVAMTDGARRDEPDGPPTPHYGGVREEIMALLSRTPDGLESTTIARLLAARFGDAVAPRSHLAILSRLRDGGLAIKADGRWRLTAAGFAGLIETAPRPDF